MTANFEQFLTERGKAKMEFFKQRGIGCFYNPMMGNLEIDNEDFQLIKNDVLEFIAEFWEDRWVLSHCDGMWYVHQLED